LSYEFYRLLKDGFKEWADELKKKDEAFKMEILSNLEYFEQKKELFENSSSELLLEVSDNLIEVN